VRALVANLVIALAVTNRLLARVWIWITQIQFLSFRAFTRLDDAASLSVYCLLHHVRCLCMILALLNPDLTYDPWSGFIEQHDADFSLCCFYISNSFLRLLGVNLLNY